MKVFIKYLSIIVFLLGISLVSCDMDHSGYKVTYFTITYEIYDALADIDDPDEALAYVKTATKKDGGTYWCQSPGLLRDFFYEKCGYNTNVDEVIQEVKENRIVARRFRPGIF